ncbi:MAG: carboxymuconolactone decarboxylase family protein [Helicobacteraceae bacterium]|jgi:alkylhydroperoxidase/carboxymuconolactone decarboxylase family protein YurZ/quercetin dioxygenase-like cupin family protein|nr:carboxymuconolactone decarboxylase family protein [Helicobacteraceae bacterium]
MFKSKSKALFAAIAVTVLISAVSVANAAGAANAQNKGATVIADNKKVTAGRDQLGSLAPKFAELNDDVLFGQVWSREAELSPRDRSLVTIVSLIASGNFPQLKFHLQKGKDNGLSKQEIVEVITQQAFYSGWPKAWSAFSIVKEVYGENDTAKHINLANSTIFPLGEPVNPKWFKGRAWLHGISTQNPFNTPIFNVTFEPAARNHWHSHDVGQILLVTGGEGWYQERGKTAQKLKEGDVVNIAANTQHWHGATKDSWFVHLAINQGESKWFEPVSDKDYNSLDQ